jgi:hypothetical protein
LDQNASSAPVEAGQFDGDWINTSASPQGWHALQTSYLEGVPAIRARLKDGTVVEFSGITLYGGIGSNDLAAFRAEHVGKGSRILLQGNLNLGLLVLATFKIPTAGGIGFFSREFFARSRLAAPGMAASGDSDALFEQFNTRRHPVDKHGGRWHTRISRRGACWRSHWKRPGRHHCASLGNPGLPAAIRRSVGPCRYADLCLPR